MSRKELSEHDREHGRRLGDYLAKRRRREAVSAQDLATAAGVSVDTVRSVETGRVATPAFLTVARLAGVLGVSLDDVHSAAVHRTGRRRR
ncbi:MAG TPA: helix-turn-helix transcriptional regulator [Mycobacteriales bacterium]|nr:helix-turn-helix transcriptional regulator [Mycobacteriales bacterium]